MALIKCNHCGKIVSDRAAKCPHCGCNPLEKNEKPQNVVEETIRTDTSNVSDGNSNERSFGISKTLIVTVIVLIVVALGGAAFLWLHHGKSQVAEKAMVDETPEGKLSIQFCKNIGKYEQILGNFSEGLLPVVKNRMLGYINANGDEIVPCSLKYYIETSIEDIPIYGDFHDGLARVSTFEGTSGADYFDVASSIRFGFIDETGRLVIPYSYTRAEEFSEGKAYVEYDSFRGFIDTTGKHLFSVNGLVNNFSDGLARVSDYPKLYFVDEKGNTTLTLPSEATVEDFHDGLAFYEEYGGWKGLIDKSGNHVIDFTMYKIVNNFSEGLAAVSKDGETFGFIDTTGNFVIPISYSGIIGEGDFRSFADFHEGLCRIYNEGEGKWFFINKKNEVVLSSIEGHPSDMNEGFSCVAVYDQEKDVINYSILTRQGFNTNTYAEVQ